MFRRLMMAIFSILTFTTIATDDPQSTQNLKTLRVYSWSPTHSYRLTLISVN